MPSYHDFCEAVAAYYAAHGREMPWRQPDADGSFDPYKILVSELMLQQTQVQRVMPKYTTFIERFPTVESLAAVSLGDVLVLWQGLGYNRRAKYLWQCAKDVVEARGGEMPTTQMGLTDLPGVGENTAGAICAYAYNQPVQFIETNIRTVFLHEFFPDREQVSDSEVRTVVEDTLESGAEALGSYREWYWALMDYGSHLKSVYGNASRRSKSYTKQSPLQGSRRQVRGLVLKLLAEDLRSFDDLQAHIIDERLEDVLTDLIKEGLVRFDSGHYHL